MMLITAQNWYEACSKREQAELDMYMDLEERIHELRHSLNSDEQQSLALQLHDITYGESDLGLIQYRKEKLLELWEAEITAT